MNRCYSAANWDAADAETYPSWLFPFASIKTACTDPNGDISQIFETPSLVHFVPTTQATLIQRVPVAGFQLMSGSPACLRALFVSPPIELFSKIYTVMTRWTEPFQGQKPQ